MKILFLTHAFNSLTQRLFVELRAKGHEISIEYDINDSVTIEAVELYKPDLIIAPYLRRAIPEEIWKNHVCLIVHPGPVGDRGPSSLDWAVLEGKAEWGVTVLQADAEMDAGDIWASHNFPMREAAKGSLYRNEVMEAAVKGVLEAVGKFADEEPDTKPLNDLSGWKGLMKQEVRAIDWALDDTATVLRKIRCADGFPGVKDEILGLPCFLYDAHPEEELSGAPGAVIAKKDGAICLATTDGAVWVTHLKERRDGEKTFKLPAVEVLGGRLEGVAAGGNGSWQEIWYERKGEIGYLYFPFYNGAMSTNQCRRLLAAYEQAAAQDTQVLALMGGEDFWSNGIHLNTIEAAESPADESWENINAMDDLCRAILSTTNQTTVAVMRGNAGAGGVFLGLCADKVIARNGIILNPHYKNMGNLYGSEYWTYVLPRRAGEEAAETIMGNRLPLGCDEALEKGLLDKVIEVDFDQELDKFLIECISLENSSIKLNNNDLNDVLAGCRDQELERMKLNFYGFDPSYHVARFNFVYKVPHSRTPLHLALHRKGN